MTALKPKRRQDILAEYEELIAPGLELIELKTAKFCLFMFVVSCLLFALDLAFRNVDHGSNLRNSIYFQPFSTLCETIVALGEVTLNEGFQVEQKSETRT